MPGKGYDANGALQAASLGSSLNAGLVAWDFVASSAQASALVHKRFALIDLAAAAGDVVLTLPAPNASGPTYCGAKVITNANGKTVTIQSSTGVLVDVLYVEDEAVQLAWEPGLGKWLNIGRNVHRCDFTARLTPLGCWMLDGVANAPQDLSGNGRHLARDAGYPTQRRSSGVRSDLTADSFGRSFYRADAAFYLLNDFSIECIARANYSVGVSGDLISYGAGTGGAVNNTSWSLYLYNGTAGSGTWSFRHQTATNAWYGLYYSPEAYVSFEWQHVVVTRGAWDGAKHAVNVYVNGQLASLATGTWVSAQATGGQNTNQIKINGAGPNMDVQGFSVWGSVLTAAQVRYLAKLRLGGRRN